MHYLPSEHGANPRTPSATPDPRLPPALETWCGEALSDNGKVAETGQWRFRLGERIRSDDARQLVTTHCHEINHKHHAADEISTVYSVSLNRFSNRFYKVKLRLAWSSEYPL